MHLASHLGNTGRLIEIDGFDIVGRVDSLFAEDSRGNMARSTALELLGFTQVFETHTPDFVLLLGDRGEMLAAATSCAYLGIPTAHIGGGDVTGTVDEMLRHAISKLSSLHFPATYKSRCRLIAMGEDEQRVILAGAPRLDVMRENNIPSLREVTEHIGCTLTPKNFGLLIFHPTVTEISTIESQIIEVLAGCEAINLQILCIMPNADAGNSLIRRHLERMKDKFIIVDNLTPMDYLRVLHDCRVIIGNSSSGIVEAATYHIPVINIGTRQQGREQSANVVNSDPDRLSIMAAYSKTQASDFQKQLPSVVNVYGDGNAVSLIVETLNSFSGRSELAIKQFIH
jgi:GDP/UDP-N,N'-diacetylbacillosamine 2-epimerase (hydrolysing)